MPTLPRVAPTTGVAQSTIYNQIFWLSFTANACAVASNALTFRFAELVAWLGGNEYRTGQIVSAGVIGALSIRLVLGQAIDRFGVRLLWTGATLFIVSSSALFFFATEISWPLYAARLLFDVGLAVVSTCSIVHIQNQVPPRMRTEIIASLGSSGFIGMISGALLGDAIFKYVPEGDPRFRTLFGASALLAVTYAALVFVITRRDVHVRPHETPSAPALLARYWPGMVVLVAMMMGVWFTVFSVFLTRFASHLGMTGIGTFFVGYCLCAFTFRLLCRNWDRTLGRHRMILIGLTANAIGCVMLPLVTKPWHFLFPACCCGLGHALLFPAVVSLGAGKFPRIYRGTGTTIVLGFTEVGRLIFAPILGKVIDRVGFTAMFLTVTAAMTSSAALYALTAARKPDADLEPIHDGHDTPSQAMAAAASVVIQTPPAGDAIDEPDDEEVDQPVALPFPNLERSA